MSYDDHPLWREKNKAIFGGLTEFCFWRPCPLRETPTGFADTGFPGWSLHSLSHHSIRDFQRWNRRTEPIEPQHIPPGSTLDPVPCASHISFSLILIVLYETHSFLPQFRDGKLKHYEVESPTVEVGFGPSTRSHMFHLRPGLSELLWDDLSLSSPFHWRENWAPSSTSPILEISPAWFLLMTPPTSQAPKSELESHFRCFLPLLPGPPRPGTWAPEDLECSPPQITHQTFSAPHGFAKVATVCPLVPMQQCRTSINISFGFSNETRNPH